MKAFCSSIRLLTPVDGKWWFYFWPCARVPNATVNFPRGDAGGDAKVSGVAMAALLRPSRCKREAGKRSMILRGDFRLAGR